MHRLVRAIPGPVKAEAGAGVRAEEADSQTYALFRRMFEVLAGTLDAEAGGFVRERSFRLMLKLFPSFQAVGPSCTSSVLRPRTG